MVTIQIPDEIARQLAELAQRENRTVDEVAASILKDNVPKSGEDKTPAELEESNPLDAIMGILNVDAIDMSTTVKETLREYYRKKYGSVD